jgi:hypothetical protein
MAIGQNEARKLFKRDAKDKTTNAELVANRYATRSINMKKKPNEKGSAFAARYNKAYDKKFKKNLAYIKSVR